jgi:hypothetical protein
VKAELSARESAKIAYNSEKVAQNERLNAVTAAQKADSSARITEASRLRVLALQVKEDDPTLALQLIKMAIVPQKTWLFMGFVCI